MNPFGTITLDWASIFDILSVYNVKINLCSGEKAIANEKLFSNLAEEIKRQIGHDNFFQIIGSNFYEDLYNCNLEIFILVDKVKESPELGKEIDEKNFERHKIKKALQKHFFGSDLNEIKVGYEKN